MINSGQLVLPFKANVEKLKEALAEVRKEQDTQVEQLTDADKAAGLVLGFSEAQMAAIKTYAIKKGVITADEQLTKEQVARVKAMMDEEKAARERALAKLKEGKISMADIVDAGMAKLSDED